MTWIVYVFIAIALAGVAGIIVTARKKKTMAPEEYKPVMSACICLTVIFTLMSVMTAVFSS